MTVDQKFYIVVNWGFWFYGGLSMVKWECTVCGYIYDPEEGDPDGDIAPGTPFEQLPDDWVCPVCGASKDKFIKKLEYY